jgi:hypothetical protein
MYLSGTRQRGPPSQNKVMQKVTTGPLTDGCTQWGEWVLRMSLVAAQLIYERRYGVLSIVDVFTGARLANSTCQQVARLLNQPTDNDSYLLT